MFHEREYLSWISGKSVIIVGPAPTIAGQGLGSWIDSHDVVVRINSGVPHGQDADYGSRTDVIYHTLFTDRHAAANGEAHGPELTQSWIDQGVQWIVTRRKAGDERCRIFAPTVAGLIPWISCHSTATRLAAAVKGKGLNTGTVAVAHILSSRAASIYVTGFDFHSTGYVVGTHGMDAERAAQGVVEGRVA